METVNRELVMNKIAGMSKEQVAKVLIFMAGMEAEHIIWKQRESRQQNSQKQKRFFRIKEVPMHFRNFFIKKASSFSWKAESVQRKADIERVMQKPFH